MKNFHLNSVFSPHHQLHKKETIQDFWTWGKQCGLLCLLRPVAKFLQFKKDKLATRNITLNKKWDLSPEELGRAAPNIEADTHFSPICIASLASLLWLLTKNRAVLSMHVGFVDTQYYNFFLCILPIAELHARTRRVSVAPYLRKCGNLPIRENLVIKWP